MQGGTAAVEPIFREEYGRLIRLHVPRRHAARAHRTGRGRPIAAAVHLLPPGARTGGADRADARLLGGLTVAGIAQPFLVPETTMAQRITRAKKKFAAAKVPYRVPEAADLPERLGGVLAVLFLVFNEGYLATGDGDPVRAELTGEAIRLTRVLASCSRGAGGGRSARAAAAHRGPA